MRYIVNKLSKYQWKTYPHRCLLILDDFASHPLLRSKETDLSRLLKKLRHFKNGCKCYFRFRSKAMFIF